MKEFARDARLAGAAVDDVKREFDRLVNMAPTFRVDAVRPSPAPAEPGVYVLSEGSRARYVGRTGDLRARLAAHRSSAVESATLAVKLARKAAGKPATYRRGTSARALYDNDLRFRAAFREARAHISAMRVRYVVMPEDEDDGVCQALLEIYAASALRTLERDGGFNSFRNH